MALVNQKDVVFEVDGIDTFWETVSDFGETATEGQIGIDPNTGQRITGASDPNIDNITLTAIFDDETHNFLLKEILKVAPNPWRDGNKKGTLIYKNARYIVNGVSVIGYKIPGRNGTSNDYGRFSLTVKHKGLTPGN
jgi:hypothetical protein